MDGAYWIMMGCNVLSPQIFWIKKNEKKPVGYILHVSILVNMGMWFERFVIIVTSVYRDYLPSCMEYLLQTYNLGSRILYGNIWIVLYLLFPVLQNSSR